MSSMMLDGFVTEAVDSDKKDETQKAANASVLEPVPILMPEPHIMEIPPVNSEGPTTETMPAVSVAPPPTSIPALVSYEPVVSEVQEEAKPVAKSRKSKDSGSSSSSSSKSKKNNDPPTEKDMQNVDFDVDGNEVISHDPLLSRDVPSLSYFLHEHGSLKPNYWVSIQGTHTERRTRVVVRDGKRVQENYTVTIVDFDFNIDLSQLLELDPIFYTVADSVPAYRGGMRMSAEENGPTNIERRRFVSGDEQDAQEAWLDDSERRGVPPWTIPPSKSHNQEEKNVERTTKPLASSRSFEDWLVDYCRSKRVIKDFKLSKVIYGWNQNALTQSIEELIRSTGYYVSHSHASVHIKFHSSSTCVHVRSPNFVSKIFSSWVLMTLFSLILVFPFLWLWRRYWPGAGGKWSVAGVGFPVKRWELLKGTFPGDTVEAVKARLASMPVKQKEEEKRLKAEPDGVWILQGTHEGDWFRAWELSIRLAARDRQRVKWLSRQTLDHERIDANILAGELDRL